MEPFLFQARDARKYCTNVVESLTFRLPISVMTVNVVFGGVWFQHIKHIKLALHARAGAAEH